MSFDDKGLGRLPSKDERDKNFTVRKLLAVAPGEYPRPSRWYRTGPTLDQSSTPRCVGYSWRQWMSSAITMTRPDVGPTATEIYYGAQRFDEWEGEDYDGTSVRGGAKYLQSIGRISSYHWATTTEEMKDFLLRGLGTVVFGSNWYDSMFSPDQKTGFLTVGGSIAGGHAYLCIGYSKPRDAFRYINSWSDDFAQKGRFWLRTADVQRLLEEDGEACCAVEIKKT